MENLNIGAELNKALEKYEKEIELFIISNAYGDSSVEAIIADKTCITIIAHYSANSVMKSVHDIVPHIGASFEAGLSIGYYIGKYLEAQNGKT